MDNKLLGFALGILVTKFANCLPSVAFSTQRFAVGMVVVELIGFFNNFYSTIFGQEIFPKHFYQSKTRNLA